MVVPAVGDAHPRRAGPPGPAGPRRDPGGSRGGARTPWPCPPKTAWTRGGRARRVPPLAGRGTRADVLERRPVGPAPRALASRSGAASATPECSLTDTPSARPMTEIGQTSPCPSQSPEPRRVAASRRRARPYARRRRCTERRAFSRERPRGLGHRAGSGTGPAAQGSPPRCRAVIVPGSESVQDPSSRNRLMQAEIVHHRDEGHPARPNALDRLAPCTSPDSRRAARRNPRCRPLSLISRSSRSAVPSRRVHRRPGGDRLGACEMEAMLPASEPRYGLRGAIDPPDAQQAQTTLILRTSGHHSGAKPITIRIVRSGSRS